MLTSARVITVTLNPAIDMKMIFREPQIGGLNRAERVHLEPSGKGVNVSRALRSQGIATIAVALLGGPFGAMIKDELEAAHLPLICIPTAGATRCNVKVIDAESGASTEFNAPGPSIAPEELESLKAALRDNVGMDDLVVFSGSIPNNLKASIYADLITEAQALGARTVLDADRAALRQALAAHPFLVKPNQHEAEELLGVVIDTSERALEAARLIQARGVPHVVLSLGAKGAIFLSPTEAYLVVPPRVRPRSTVGSGDALLSGVLCGIVRGWSWGEGARYATALAAARTQNEGIDFPNSTEIERHLEQVQVIALEAQA